METALKREAKKRVSERTRTKASEREKKMDGFFSFFDARFALPHSTFFLFFSAEPLPSLSPPSFSLLLPPFDRRTENSSSWNQPRKQIRS